MKINPVIGNMIKENNNMITTAQVLSLGFSKTLLMNYVKEGLLERIGHGLFTIPDGIVDDMYTLMLRSDKIIFSHDTALFLNGLSERTPFIHSLTIPSNAVLPIKIRENCICYYIKPEYHSMGMIQRETTFGNVVRCYNQERTVCDVLRSRNRLDEETVINAIKIYAASMNRNLNLLAVYAEKLRVSTILKKYLEVLI
jgi:predicted transcriptional regulator of viral defense system